MKREIRGVVVIGGGPAGLAAALSAVEAGCRDVLLLERDIRLGGILNQCIHDGFGLHAFGEALSGPEYAARYIDRVRTHDIEVRTGSMVLSLSRDRVLEVSSRNGYGTIRADAVVLAMGCRERTREALSIPGARPSGIYTAGAAQNLMNLENILPGRRAVILGSGDIGLIMARRMVLEGASVEGVYEVLPYASGLPRNLRQCLDDYGIPLHLSTTVTEVRGAGRLEGVTVSRVDESRSPIPGTEREVPCDVLLLSVGLIPENELSRGCGISLDSRTGGAVVDETFMTDVPGVFACGNALHVHDLVDWVSVEAAEAGREAANWAAAFRSGREPEVPTSLPVKAGEGVRYVLPGRLRGGRDAVLSLRVLAPGRNRDVILRVEGRDVLRRTFPRVHPAEMLRLAVPGSDLPPGGVVEVVSS